MFKLGNIRESQLAAANIKLTLIKSRQTAEGEFIPFQNYDMKLAFNDLKSDMFFPWPITVEHVRQLNLK